MFEKLVVVDAKGHVLGRLASYIAKELQNGQRIVVVRAEQLNISGSLFRTRMRFAKFMHVRMVHKPTRCLQHYKSPSRIFWKTVRGMLNHKTSKGEAAIGKLKVFEGVPAPYDTKKRKVVPNALKIVRLRNDQEFCTLGQLSTSFGWKKQNIIEKLEESRKVRSSKYYLKKVAERNTKLKALNLPAIKNIKSELAKFGY